MILLLHGALGSGEQLRPLQNELVQGESLIVEFPGHGITPDVNAGWTIDAFTDYLHAVIADEAIKSDANHRTNSAINVFGFSMGGYVALNFAIRYPGILSKIFTLGTKLVWDPDVGQREISRMNPDKIEQKVPQYANLLKKRHGENRWREVLINSSQMIENLSNDPVLTLASVSQIHIPILYGLGDADDMVTLEETIAFQNATPNAELLILKDTQHPIEKANPQMLSQHLSEFFGEHESG